MRRCLLFPGVTWQKARRLCAYLIVGGSVSCGTSPDVQSNRSRNVSIKLTVGALTEQLPDFSPAPTPTPILVEQLPSPSPSVAPNNDPGGVPQPTATPSPIISPLPSPVTDSDGSVDTSDNDETGEIIDSIDNLDTEDRSACASELGVPVNHIKVVGNQSDVHVNSEAALAVKIAGNQSRLDLTLSGDAEAHIAGLCLFVTGNQGVADVKVNVRVGRIVYKGRGNQSHGEITVNDHGSVDELSGDLRGNQATLHIKGVGDHTCGTVSTGGHAARYSCE